MPKKLTWYCPCNCKTPKGLHEKFYVITTLFTHINDSHSKKLDIKFLYRVKPSPDSIVNVGKKRSIEDDEEGFKELMPVEEEDIENDIDALIETTSNLKIEK